MNMDDDKSPASKITRQIRDVTASAIIQAGPDLEQLERSESYLNASKVIRDQMKVEAIKKKSIYLQNTVVGLLDLEKSQAVNARYMEKKLEEEKRANLMSGRDTTRNARDIVTVYKTFDGESRRINERMVRINGLELEYAYDGVVGVNKWTEKGTKLLTDLAIPISIRESDTGPIDFDWGFRDEPVVWSPNNQVKSRRTVDQQKKTSILATFSTTRIPRWLISRAGADRVKAVKGDQGLQYSKFLSISAVLGPGGEAMARYVNDTRSNMVYAKNNRAAEFPSLSEIDKIYTDASYNHIIKLVLNKPGQKKQFIKVPYDELPYHPLTSPHTPSFSNDPKKKRPQPLNVMGRASILRKRVHEEIEGRETLEDEELLEDKLSRPKNATPYQYRAANVPSNISEGLTKLLISYNTDAKERFDINQKSNELAVASASRDDTNVDMHDVAGPSGTGDGSAIVVDSRIASNRTVVSD